MSVNESFTSSTDAIVHDSDPRLLNFKQWNSVTGVETKLGTSVNMGLFTVPEITTHAAVVGPTIASLTGGTAALANPSKFENLTGGQVDISIHNDDDTNTVIASFTGDDLATLAVAQGLGSAITGNIDIISLVNLTDFQATVQGKNFGTVLGGNLQWDVISTIATNDSTTLLTIDIATKLEDQSNVYQNVGTSFSALTIASGASNAPIPFAGNLAAGNLLLGIQLFSTGTANNYVEALLAPPPVTLGKLAVGSLTVEVVLENSTVLGPFTISYTDLIAMAPNTGTKYFRSDNAQLNWDLSGLVGHNIVSYSWTMTGFDTTIDRIDSIASHFTMTVRGITVEPGAGGAAWDPGVTSSGSGPMVTDTVPANWGFLEFFIEIYGTGLTQLFRWELDAATIVSRAGIAGQTALQTALVQLTDINPYYLGWSITNIRGDFYASYGPDTNAVPSIVNVQFKTAGGAVATVSPSQGATGSTSSPIGHWDSNAWDGQVIDGTTEMYAYVDLYVRSVAAYDTAVDVIMTEAYELRHRNRATFRFIATPPSADFAGPFPSFIAVAYGSQGLLGTPLEYWTGTFMCRLHNDGNYAGPAMASVITTEDTHYDLGWNYQGTVLTKAVDGQNLTYAGDNFLRFLLMPPGEVSLAGWTLQILASAREL